MPPISINKDLSNSRISLEGKLDQTTVMQVWPTLAKDLSAIKQTLILDLNKIEHVDSAGLAWLLSLQKKCADQQLQLQFENLPSSLIRLAKISDVEALLSLQ